MKDVKLGKIQEVTFGFGGYQDAMFGLTLTFGGEGWGVSDFIGSWATYPSGAKYAIEVWEKRHLHAYLTILEYLNDARVSDVTKLKGIPVEVTFENDRIVSWRVLKEVL